MTTRWPRFGAIVVRLPTAEALPRHVVHLRQSSAGSAGNIQGLFDGTIDIALTANPDADPTKAGVELQPPR